MNSVNKTNLKIYILNIYVVFRRVQTSTSTRPSRLNIMAFFPKHPKWKQTPKSTPLSETMSNTTPFICEFFPHPPSPRVENSWFPAFVWTIVNYVWTEDIFETNKRWSYEVSSNTNPELPVLWTKNIWCVFRLKPSFPNSNLQPSLDGAPMKSFRDMFLYEGVYI